jgi:hypothetical protein
LALKAALCRLRFAFIGLLFLIYSKPAKIETCLWSKNRGPAQSFILFFVVGCAYSLQFFAKGGAHSDHRHEALPGRGLSAEARQRIVQHLKTADKKTL